MARILMTGDPAEVQALLHRVAAAAAHHTEVGQHAARAVQSGGGALVESAAGGR
jgi:hypothetical protein